MLKKKIVDILKENGIKRAGIFGSFARGEDKKNSDIDILVEITHKNFSLLDFIRLKLNLEDKTKRKIDLVEYKAIKLHIREHALKEEVRII